MVDRNIFVVPEKIHLYIHVEGGGTTPVDITAKLNQILAALGGIKTQETAMALEVQGLIDQVNTVVSTEASAATVIAAIQAAVADLSAQLADQPAVQAQLDALAQQLGDANAPLAAAIANVPTTP